MKSTKDHLGREQRKQWGICCADDSIAEECWYHSLVTRRGDEFPAHTGLLSLWILGILNDPCPYVLPRMKYFRLNQNTSWRD